MTSFYYMLVSSSPVFFMMCHKDGVICNLTGCIGMMFVVLELMINCDSHSSAFNRLMLGSDYAIVLNFTTVTLSD